MMTAIIAAIGTVVELAHDHPEIAAALYKELRELLGGHEQATIQNIEAQRALAAGIAARCAVAVQEAMRAHRPDIERARTIVASWKGRTTVGNQALLQQAGVAELCAELLRDVRP